MSNEMIERVAKALVKAGLPLCDEIKFAKAAIEAMREPSQHMIEVGKKLRLNVTPITNYKFLIDAALKED